MASLITGHTLVMDAVELYQLRGVIATHMNNASEGFVPNDRFQRIIDALGVRQEPNGHWTW